MHATRICLCLLPLLVTAASAQPVITHTTPMAVARGKKSQITFHGSGLKGEMTWSQNNLGAVFEPGQGDSVICQVDIPADFSKQIFPVRIATSSGISSPILIFIDDLPTIQIDNRARKMELAQAITPPVAVEGTATEAMRHYLKFTGHKGQRISVDAVAGRLGSRFDPLIRLWDEHYNELMVGDDDRSSGPDARFTMTLPADGEYFLEVRDAFLDGSPQHRFRLRVGDFATTPPPFPLPFARPRLPAIVEAEPNEAWSEATRFSWPVTLNGRFDRLKDRDVYQFAARKGDRVMARSRTRSLRSACDASLRIAKADGTKLADSKNDAADEASVDATIPEDGNYLLIVEELAGEGGPGMAYRVDIEPYGGVSLSCEVEKIDIAAGGQAEVKVTAVRRDYKGQIALSVEGGPPGIGVSNDVIKEGQNDVQLRIRMPVDAPVGRPMALRIVGKATIDGVERVVDVSTMPGLRKAFPAMRYPPQELDGEIGLGIKPPAPTTKPTVEKKS
jgi:hypothetical protein